MISLGYQDERRATVDVAVATADVAVASAQFVALLLLPTLRYE